MNAMLAKIRANKKPIAAYIGWLIFCAQLTILAAHQAHIH